LELSEEAETVDHRDVEDMDYQFAQSAVEQVAPYDNEQIGDEAAKEATKEGFTADAAEEATEERYTADAAEKAPEERYTAVADENEVADEPDATDELQYQSNYETQDDDNISPHTDYDIQADDYATDDVSKLAITEDEYAAEELPSENYQQAEQSSSLDDFYANLQ